MEYNIELCGQIGTFECSYHEVKKKLNALKGKKVKCRINSPGGYASDGFQIMQAFREHGDVTVYLDGIVASAATIISMGAKKIIISPYTQYLIHQCSTGVLAWQMMNQDEIRKFIEEMQQQLSFNEKMDQMAATLYADRSGKSIEEMSQLMHNAIWMDPKQVIELGLADEMGEKVGKRTEMDSVMMARLQSLNLPIPKVTEEPEEENMVDSIVSKLAARLAAIFNLNKELPLVEEQDTNTPTMNKTFTAVMALLAVEAIACADGKVQVTEEQMKSINDALASLNTTQESLANAQASVTEKENQLATMQTEIDNLKAQMLQKDNEIAKLKKEPAASTHNVVTQPSNPDAELSDEEASNFATALASRFRS